MNKIPLLLSLLLHLVSCNANKAQYSIDGHIKGLHDGDTVRLACSHDGIALEQVSHSVVKDGRFSFEGDANGCKVAYICCDGDNYDLCTLIFLEEGDINVSIDGGRCTISGTPINELCNSVEDSIGYYVDELEKIEFLYYSRQLDDAAMASLGAQGFNLQQQLISYLRETITENIENLFGLYMLVAYNDFFTTQELHSLIEKIPPSSIDRENNPFYDIIIDIVAQRDAL